MSILTPVRISVKAIVHPAEDGGLKSVTGRQFCQALQRKGWTLIRSKGSHQVWEKDGFPNVSVSVHAGNPSTWSSGEAPANYRNYGFRPLNDLTAIVNEHGGIACSGSCFVVEQRKPSLPEIIESLYEKRFGGK